MRVLAKLIHISVCAINKIMYVICKIIKKERNGKGKGTTFPGVMCTVHIQATLGLLTLHLSLTFTRSHSQYLLLQLYSPSTTIHSTQLKHTSTRTSTMSNAPSTYRRRPGRAPSPPTWLWYEQIPYDDDSSDSDGSAEFESCSEDDDDYTARTTAVNVSNPTTANTNSATGGGARGVDTDHAHAEHDNSSESGSDDSSHRDIQSRKETSEDSADKMDVDSPVGANAENGAPSVDPGIEAQSQTKKDIKGKQRAVDPPEVEESPKTRERKKKSRRQVCTLRPILTIQKSQGFVWNQVRLF